MLKNVYEQLVKDGGAVKLLQVEKEYVAQLGLAAEAVEGDLTVTVLERADKESEELIAAEGADFLATPISFVKEHPEQFIYAEIEELNRIKTDAIALEFDDVFKTYTAMFAIGVQKKFKKDIQAYLMKELNVAKYPSSVAFLDKEGVWEMNIALDSLAGFSESMPLADVYALVFTFIFRLLTSLEG